MLFLHGFSDHCHAYYDFFPALAAKGIQTVSFDQRGWGKSSPTKSLWGKTGTTKDIMADLDSLLEPLFETGKPVFLMGHSAGGGLALVYGHVGTYRDKLAGILTEAPFISLARASAPLPGVETAGRLLAKFLPDFKMLNKLDRTFVSRDPEVCEAFEKDELCHDTGTLLGLKEMLERGRFLSVSNGEGWPKNLPLINLHGTGDKITNHVSTREFSERVKAAGLLVEYVELDGWYHKMHVDTKENRPVFAQLTSDWILDKAVKPTSSKL